MAKWGWENDRLTLQPLSFIFGPHLAGGGGGGGGVSYLLKCSFFSVVQILDEQKHKPYP